MFTIEKNHKNAGLNLKIKVGHHLYKNGKSSKFLKHCSKGNNK